MSCTNAHVQLFLLTIKSPRQLVACDFFSTPPLAINWYERSFHNSVFAYRTCFLHTAEQEFGNSSNFFTSVLTFFDPVCFFYSCCSQPLKKVVNSWWFTYKCTCYIVIFTLLNQISRWLFTLLFD